MKSRLLVTLAALVFASLVAVPSAIADGGSEQHRVSKGDLFASCSTAYADDAFYPAAEVEPFLAVGPKHELVGVWQQDRWEGGGAQGLVAGRSTDGGEHVKSVALPLSRCAAGGLDYFRASDPWVSIGPDGTVYVAGLGISPGDSGFTTAVTATTSSDHGKTWRYATTVKSDENSQQYFNDKESVTADPRHAGVAYVVWNRSDCTECNGPDLPTHSADPGWFSRTTDGGRTWSTPKIIVPTPNLADAVGHVIVVDPRSGRLYDLFDYFTLDANGDYHDFLGMVHSDNMGDTWSERKIIAATLDVFFSDPNNSDAYVRAGNPATPAAAIDPKTGALYVVWVDGTATDGERGEIVFSRSSDKGKTFSKPKRVSRDTGSPAFTPAVTVANDGTVAVSYFDFRTLKDGNTKTLPTSYWLATMEHGEKSFKRETRILKTPFDMLQAPDAGGYFVGDYQGLVADGHDFLSLFAMVNDGSPENRTDIYIRRLALEDGE